MPCVDPVGTGAGAASGPAPGHLVFLPDPALVTEPNFHAVALDTRRAPDRVQARGEMLLKSSMALIACAWWRGRADSLRWPVARNSRPSVCLDTVT